MGGLNYLVAIGGGIASFISPCVLPMVPIYLAIISGVSIDEMKSGRGKMSRVIFASLLFILGFTIVFAMLGLAVGFLANSFYKSLFNLALGVLIIFFGLHYTGVLRIRILDKEARFHSKKKGGIFKSFLVGFMFAFGWTPCIGPILGSILALPATKVLTKVSYTVAYSLGLAIPFLISAFAINFFYKFFDKIKKHFHKIEIAIGILLVVLGGYYIFEVFRSGDLFRKQSNVQVTDNQRSKGVTFTFKDVNGKTINLKDINAKIYLLNLWTTWCPNCVKEIPHFSKIYEKYKSKGIYILGICVEDSSSTLNDFKEYVKKLKMQYPNFFDKKAKINNYLRAYHPASKSISGYPLSFLLDKNRKIIKFIIGAKSQEKWEEILLKHLKRQENSG